MAYRPEGDFVGVGANKRLSAHTLAAFMFLQRVENIEDLRVEYAMNAPVLRRLLRKRAVEWWINSNQTERQGEPSWLVSDGILIWLTPAGLSKVIQRSHGDERISSGRLSSFNVSTPDIQLALDLITNGQLSLLGSSMALEFIET